MKHFVRITRRGAISERERIICKMKRKGIDKSNILSRFSAGRESAGILQSISRKCKEGGALLPVDPTRLRPTLPQTPKRPFLVSPKALFNSVENKLGGAYTS